MDAKQVMEALIMLAALSIVLTYLPGLVYQSTSAAPTVPVPQTNASQPDYGKYDALYGAKLNTTANVGGGLVTASVAPQLLAIVILLSVIMMLVHRGRKTE